MTKSTSFKTPIVLFIFKRGEKAAQILKHISKIKPSKLYLIGDGPRDNYESSAVEACRLMVENAINWECEVIRNYAESNRGVYLNIAGGAKWVFEKEDSAIFLEDDNFPELSFFPFCEELLKKYKTDTRILWICGTNYEKESEFPENASYWFTQNMMPCGWASWSDKFRQYYDGELSLWENDRIRQEMVRLPYYTPLKNQDITNWNRELNRRQTGLKFDSWDYQMSFSLRVNNQFGIVPKCNQITNIGVDSNSIHGGTSFENEMTRRFCGLPTKELEFPLKHPSALYLDSNYEQTIAKIITLPLSTRIKGIIARKIRSCFKIPHQIRIREFFFKK